MIIFRRRWCSLSSGVIAAAAICAVVVVAAPPAAADPDVSAAAASARDRRSALPRLIPASENVAKERRKDKRINSRESTETVLTITFAAVTIAAVIIACMSYVCCRHCCTNHKTADAAYDDNDADNFRRSATDAEMLGAVYWG